jgi:hypothetical protein
VLIRPVSPARLLDELTELILARLILARGAGAARWLRVAVDGAPPARPQDLAGGLADALRFHGRPAYAISAGDFLRPASLRLEYGRTDPDVFYDDWLDTRALSREVLAPLDPAGSGRVLPALWDAAADRATRSPYLTVPPGGVVLVSGALLLGRGLAFDLTVHLAMTAPALARRTDPAWRWTLPAYARYEEQVDPARYADVVVRVDDPRHPALVENEAASGDQQ